MTDREALGTAGAQAHPRAAAGTARSREADTDLDGARTPGEVQAEQDAGREDVITPGAPEPAALAVGAEAGTPTDGLSSGGPRRIADRIFLGLSSGSGGFVVILVLLVAFFLIDRAVPVIAKDHANFLFSRGFQVRVSPIEFGVADLLWVTFISSAVALIIAVPIAIGIALFITQYAPPALRRPVGYVIDLLAAIPSIIYGIWGIYVLAPELVPVQHALYHLGWIPLLHNEGKDTGSIFDAAVVLAVMILPIITAISRDVFERVPTANIEAALALGATKWEMIRTAVIPYGRPGVISGAMLGLGRALGETIAVLLILSKPSSDQPFTFSIFDNGQTFASLIAANMKEANGPTQTGAFISAGLVLFVLTFAVNGAARAIVARRREFV
jgi:phosphate transport system permease protein